MQPAQSLMKNNICIFCRYAKSQNPNLKWKEKQRYTTQAEKWQTNRAVRPGPVLVTGAGAGVRVVCAVTGALVRTHGLGDLTVSSAPAGLTVALAANAQAVGRAERVYAVHWRAGRQSVLNITSHTHQLH